MHLIPLSCSSQHHFLHRTQTADQFWWRYLPLLRHWAAAHSDRALLLWAALPAPRPLLPQQHSSSVSQAAQRHTSTTQIEEILLRVPVISITQKTETIKEEQKITSVHFQSYSPHI
jgi:hypothetical protein